MEDIKHPLQFEITLKRLAMTALIGHIYEHRDIKEKTKEIIRTKYHGRPWPFPFKQIKKETIKIASQKIKSLDLPRGLKSEVQGISVFFAKKCASWANHIVRIIQLDISLFDKIYWTSLGTIDCGKIFETYWKTHKSFSEIIRTTDTNSSIFTSITACKFANEEMILANQNALIKEVQNRLGRVKLPNIKNKIEQLLATYTCHVFGIAYDLENETDVYERFQRTGKIQIIEAIFLCNGNAKPVKFFWKFLNDAEKESVIMKLAEDNLAVALYCASYNFEADEDDEDEDDKDTEIENSGQSTVAETILFLINEMSPEQRIQFLTKNASAAMMAFILSWPYPELCLKLLEKEWICQSISQDGHDLLYTLLCRMVKDLTDVAYVSGSCHYPKIFHEILKRILVLVPKKVKELVFFEKSFYSIIDQVFPYAIENFYYIFDLNALSLVINDKDLEKKRDLMISMGSAKISKLIQKGNLKPVINFMEKVLTSNCERKKFIEKWDLKSHALKANISLDSREKILGWLKL